jgi:hypothetical protein
MSSRHTRGALTILDKSQLNPHQKGTLATVSIPIKNQGIES